VLKGISQVLQRRRRNSFQEVAGRLMHTTMGVTRAGSAVSTSNIRSNFCHHGCIRIATPNCCNCISNAWCRKLPEHTGHREHLQTSAGGGREGSKNRSSVSRVRTGVETAFVGVGKQVARGPMLITPACNDVA